MASAAVMSRFPSCRLLVSRPASTLRESRNVYRLRDAARPQLPLYASLARYYASKSYPPHTIISMPALSPTMTAGNIGAWQKKVGDTLSPGDVLVEIETDKAQMDFEFQEEGVLAKILKEAGEKDVSVGNPIAVMVEEGTDIAQFGSFSLEDAGGDKKPSADKTPKETPESSKGPEAEAEGQSLAQDEAKPAAEEPDITGERLQPSIDREPLISPAAKALALERGVPIKTLKGTGPGGRITKEDVEKYQPTTAVGAAAGPTYEDIPASSMHGKYKLSVNDFLIKACALALRKVPAVNSAWIEQNGQVVIRQHNTVDISVAVATPVGLITPIVKGVEGLGLESISRQVKDLGKRARDNRLKPEEFNGGTFTISNMGMNPAVERFTAVINPPQAAILAVGTTRKVAVPLETEEGTEVQWDDQIVVTGSFDHKVVDGAVGAEFMRELKKVVENPLELML
ncbi:ribosomal protein [Coccidioides immitis H538.4]|uniref:Dihydrolipoamide acetyltransferase component of pyruvate dehydrogenase complex n=3 Tax=Coccidioides immitis TaxID=5501 RepID=A0A0J8QYB7_COCIT|nr:ribosomal protein [Coccidioides immitis RMSCC 2394]KMU77889.1 ribosomal protein [Coccidioides immitis RMSCC 3703]KMU91153.1 ribosomal protein [Coccidioides immitis H538.4]